MTTNITQSAEERMAAGYSTPGQSTHKTSAAPVRAGASAEERFAAGYGRDEREKPSNAAQPPRAPLSAEERLARAYEQIDGDGADKTDDEGAEQKADGADAKPEGEGQKLTAPEGFQLDDATAKELGTLATEMKLPPGAMQELVTKTAPLLQARTQKVINDTMTAWARETLEDSEVGGDKFEGSMREANKALRTFGSRELRKLLGPVSEGGSGLGNNKHLVRFLAKVGRELG